MDNNGISRIYIYNITVFVGALTGNASTATALAASGAIALSGDTTSTGGPHTYTSGGAVTIPTTIANTTVTGKTLLNLPTPTSTAITASDTILAAMAKGYKVKLQVYHKVLYIKEHGMLALIHQHLLVVLVLQVNFIL